jgi:hypothetical protein
MNYLIERLREPSTWAGLSVVIAISGFSVSQEELAIVGAGISALLSIFIREGGK